MTTEKTDTKRPRKPTDLSARDWLEAGQRLLTEGGLRALKLRRLADELAVSTGSFYHHFSDFPAFQEALAHYFAGEHIRRLLSEADEAGDPYGKIERLVSIVTRENLTRLALAMRAWAESDPRARIAVQGQDSAVLSFLTENLRALGFADRAARLRAYALVAVGLGSIYGSNGLSGDDLAAGLLDLLCRPVGNTSDL